MQSEGGGPVGRMVTWKKGWGGTSFPVSDDLGRQRQGHTGIMSLACFHRADLKAIACSTTVNRTRVGLDTFGV